MKKMGVRWFFLLWMFFCVCTLRVISAQTAQMVLTICDIEGCNCTVKAASWIVVNCSLHEGQVVNLEYANIPATATEIYINGGREIIFSTKTFKAVPGLNLIQIYKVRRVVLEKKSFYFINSSSLLIQIKNCDELIIKTGAFEYLQSSVTTEVFDIDFVNIEPAAFSKVYNSTFKNIRSMKLHERAFDFKNQGNVARHGPVTVIIFDNVSIPKIPREVFLKSLASVSFQNCKIGDIQKDAFKATQISSIIMDDCTIDEIEEGAFAGRTLICDFKISKCNISKFQPRSVLAAIGNFSLTRSVVTDIETGAINATIARSEIIKNQIFNIHPSGLVINNWNIIFMNNNIIKHLHSKFVIPSKEADNEKFSFVSNEIYSVDEGAFAVMLQLEPKILTYDDNFFNQSCDCSIDLWLRNISNSIQSTKLIKDTSFCTVSALVSKCFSLPIGIMNIQNFTQTACKNFTVCEPYEGKTRVVDTTSRIFIEDPESTKQSWIILLITIVGLFITAIVATFVILLVRGSRWLKEKGYFRNTHYNSNDLSVEEEGTVVTIDENEKLEIPEELTIEFLQVLAQRLDNPNTHQEASEMIEHLYEMFVVDEGYETNNRLEEEAHLYEELGNLNLHTPPPPYEEEKEGGARSILRLMEEKVAQQTEATGNGTPAIIGDYSEPTDAAVHLYSELKNKNEKTENRESQNTPISENLNNSDSDWFGQPGPSTEL